MIRVVSARPDEAVVYVGLEFACMFGTFDLSSK